MREPWKIPYYFSDSTNLARGAEAPIALPRRIRIRVKAVSLQRALREGERARGRMSS